MENCVFCNIKDKEDEEIIWENKDFIAFLDKKPITPGHVLLVTKKHVRFLMDTWNELFIKIMKIAKYLNEPIKNAVKSKTVGIMLSGFEVEHVHIHLVPRNKPGEFQNPQEEASKEELNRIADKIRGEIERLIEERGPFPID